MSHVGEDGRQSRRMLAAGSHHNLGGARDASAAWRPALAMGFRDALEVESTSVHPAYSESVSTTTASAAGWSRLA